MEPSILRSLSLVFVHHHHHHHHQTHGPHYKEGGVGSGEENAAVVTVSVVCMAIGGNATRIGREGAAIERRTTAGRVSAVNA